jgi:uncharacterized protein
MMRSIFADTCYWIAIINKNDQLHEAAVKTSNSLGKVHIITADAILIEVLNWFSNSGPHLRKLAATAVNSIQNDVNTTVLAQSRMVLKKAIDLYSNRTDKSYSLTDCISMIYMENQKLTKVLTDDHHFAQEGFITLLSKPKH